MKIGHVFLAFMAAVLAVTAFATDDKFWMQSDLVSLSATQADNEVRVRRKSQGTASVTDCLATGGVPSGTTLRGRKATYYNETDDDKTKGIMAWVVDYDPPKKQAYGSVQLVVGASDCTITLGEITTTWSLFSGTRIPK